MNKRVAPAVTGLAVTMAVGTAAYLVASKTMHRNSFKRPAGKARGGVEGMVDNLAPMMK